ncbi:hypothetical protein SAMN04488132_10572 [Sediminibacterium ginsengisoli]|uniref:Uncharacterized protein n=1 Tax=Sediminibacterium ginsengisoli TaxID=413434 RepID=A0A1T4NZZ7_9BACT|nr:hypothetical protein SAMN04488132_10572 [Sediminibacterium ginsengisoli]
MYLLDMIPNNFTYSQTAENVDHYWRGDISDNPVYEFLFQGKCVIRPVEDHNYLRMNYIN